MLRRREAALAVLAGIAALALGLPALGQAKPPSARAYVVGTYDGTTLRLYVDGKLSRQKRVARTVSLSPKTHVEIGAWFGQSSFEGTIDEVAIYNRSLDAATVADHYRAGTRGGNYAGMVKGTTGVVAYWRLSDAKGRPAADALGRYPGVYPAHADHRVPGLLPFDANRAVAFNGAGGGISVPKTERLGLKRGFTLEAWAAPANDRQQTIVTKLGGWSLKTDAKGRWLVGFVSGKSQPVVFAAKPAATTPSPAGPPPALPALPPKKSPSSGGGSGGGSIGWIVIVVIAAGGVLALVAWRRAGRGSEPGAGPPGDEGLTETDGGADGQASREDAETPTAPR